jgi:hypothetical protein
MDLSLEDFPDLNVPSSSEQLFERLTLCGSLEVVVFVVPRQLQKCPLAMTPRSKNR